MEHDLQRRMDAAQRFRVFRGVVRSLLDMRWKRRVDATVGNWVHQMDLQEQVREAPPNLFCIKARPGVEAPLKPSPWSHI